MKYEGKYGTHRDTGPTKRKLRWRKSAESGDFLSIISFVRTYVLYTTVLHYPRPRFASARHSAHSTPITLARSRLRVAHQPTSSLASPL